MLDLARQAGFEGGLFLSTLANLTHPESLIQAKKLGANRVILPRELSIDEVRMLLRHQGRFFCIYDARALPRLCTALDAAGLGLRRVLPVRARRSQPATRLLVEARKNAAHETVLEAPLTLHGGAAACGGSPAWSKAALHFCPWLE